MRQAGHYQIPPGMSFLRIAPLLSLLLFAVSSRGAVEDFTVRNGLPHFMEKVKAKDEVRISYFGGSITAGAGASKPQFCYRELLTAWLAKENPGVHFIPNNAAIGGTGSELGAYRCFNDVIYQRPDLVIVEFAVNDGGAAEPQVIASMEGIVRQLRRAASKPDILFVYTMVKDHLEDFKAGKLPRTMQYHEKVAEHYGIPSVCMAKHSAEVINSGKMTIEDFTKDGVHPKDAGYALYLEALKPFFEKIKEQPGTTPDPLPKALSPHSLENAKLVSYDWAQMDADWLGWQLSSSSNIPHVAVANKPGATMTLKFKGSAVGIYDIIGPDTGNIDFSLDGGEWRHRVNFDKYCLTYARPSSTTLVGNLDPAVEHELKLRIAEDTPEGSKGRFTRLGWFLVDGTVKDPTGDMDPLKRIDTIYAGMKAVTWQAPANRWTNLEKTKAKLEQGPSCTMVMLGDSIIGDTCSSNFDLLLGRDYPKCAIKKVVSVRGSTGCWWYKDDNHVESYVLQHKPDLLVIGGISQREDIDSIRTVIHQCREKLPNLEVLLITPVFGSPQGAFSVHWTPEPDEKAYPYRAQLRDLAAQEKCGFFDMTRPWMEYIRASSYALDSFKRDPIHANDRGKQILGRLMEKFLGP